MAGRPRRGRRPPRPSIGGHIHRPAAVRRGGPALHRQRGHVRDLLPGARGSAARPPRPGRRATSARPRTQETIHDDRGRSSASTTRSSCSTAGSSKGIVVGADYNTGPATVHCPAPCLGYSFITQNPVLPDLLDRLPVTLSLAAGAAVHLAGRRRRAPACSRRCDAAASSTGRRWASRWPGVSLPIFFTGLLSLSIFSYGLGWITAPGGSYTPFDARTRCGGPTTCSCRGSRWRSSTRPAYARLTRAGHARDDERGLHPHRAGQGPARAHGGRQARRCGPRSPRS